MRCGHRTQRNQFPASLHFSLVLIHFITLLDSLFPMVFTILTSLPTASITPLKQPYCISKIISSMPSDHRSCHVFASLICLRLLITLAITS